MNAVQFTFNRNGLDQIKFERLLLKLTSCFLRQESGSFRLLGLALLMVDGTPPRRPGAASLQTSVLLGERLSSQRLLLTGVRRWKFGHVPSYNTE